MLSKYCKEIADKYNIKVGNIKKLIPNLRNRIKYVLHYEHFPLYLFLGMKLILNLILKKEKMQLMILKKISLS